MLQVYKTSFQIWLIDIIMNILYTLYTFKSTKLEIFCSCIHNTMIIQSHYCILYIDHTVPYNIYTVSRYSITIANLLCFWNIQPIYRYIYDS